LIGVPATPEKTPPTRNRRGSAQQQIYDHLGRIRNHVTDTQDQLDVLPASDAKSGAPTDAKERAKRRSGSLSTMLLPELQALAGSMGLAPGKMRKSDLIAAIEGAKGSSAPKTAAPATTTRTRRSATRPAGAAQPTLTDVAPAPDTAVAPPRDQASDVASPRAETDAAAPVETQNRQQGERAERTNQGNRNRESQNRDGQNQGSQNRSQGGQNSGDGQGRNQGGQSAGDGQGRSQGSQNRNQGGQNQNRNDGGPRNNNTDDDDEFGGNRRGRRYRDRRGRSRDRFDGGQGGGTGGGRNDAEPVIAEDDVLVPVAGILDSVEDKNTWFIRSSGYFASADDVYVANSHVRRYGLRRGDAVTGAVRQPREGERKEKFNPLVRLDTVNGANPEEAKNRVEFTKMTPLYPQDRLRLETEPHILTTRVIDLVMPIGKGQRALIVSPPKAGKTMVLQAIANAIATNNPECHLMVVLIDERPEEVTDMQRSVKGEVIASTFDRRPQDHITVAELSIERAKRLVELGHDVVVLLDSITRLGRAYNLGAPASGRILSGGVDSTALYPPKRFLGAARNIEDGGSLTILATALVETGSAGDTVIFEEFKGTGNAELKLDRKIADKRVYPAIDVDQSSTRKEEILLSPDELAVVIKLRRVLHALDPQQGIDLLLDRLKKTRTNIEFLMQIAKTTPGADDR
jgi:transcription termination factor Rho